MATPASAKPASRPSPVSAWLKEHGKNFASPYYIVVGAVVGGITVGFIVLTLVIVLVATNFNVLGLIE